MSAHDPQRATGGGRGRTHTAGWELAAALVCVAGLPWVVWLRAELTPWAALALGAALVVLPLVLLRRAWVPLFGPVLYYDVVRAARRGRHVVLRVVYLTILLFALAVLFAERLGGLGSIFGDPVHPLSPQEVAQFAEAFFTLFAVVQFLAVLAVTPALTAGAIAEEKERKTLDYLLATHLTSPDIVFGKLFSRLATLTLLLLTGLPVLSLLQFLGGVDPQLVIAAFLITAVTMLSLAALSILNSVWFTRPLTAIILTYVQVAFYLVLTCVVDAWTEPASPFKPGGPTLSQTLLDLFCSGNPVVFFWHLQAVTNGTVSGTVSAVVAAEAFKYVSVHLLWAVLLLLVATLPLRAWVRHQASGRGRRSFVLALTQKRLPRVWDHAMAWKEFFAEPMFRFNRSGMVAVATFFTICLILGSFILVLSFAWGLGVNDVPGTMNGAVRLLGTFMGSVLLLGVAVRAAGSISGERVRGTFDDLLTSPIANADILRSKWLGAVLGGRKIWWFLGVVWLAGVVTTGMHPLALPLVAAAWLAQAMFFGSLGLWLSLVSKNSLRATLWTLAIVAGLCLGPYVVGLVGRAFFGPSTTSYRPRDDIWAAGYVTVAVSPPFTYHALSFNDHDFIDDPYARYYPSSQRESASARAWGQIIAAVAGMVVYALGALFFMALSEARFADVTGRMPYGRPRVTRRQGDKVARRPGDEVTSGTAAEVEPEAAS
jgi:ABC-type transport system involved in multi-copper enzyme maturation permease subunit